MRKLLLCHGIQNVALVFGIVKRFFQKIPAAFFVVFNARIVAGDHIVEAQLFGALKQFIEF